MPDQEHYPDGVDRWFGWQSDGKGHNDYEAACAEADTEAAIRVARESAASKKCVKELSKRAELVRRSLEAAALEINSIVYVLLEDARAQVESLRDIERELTQNGKHDVDIPSTAVDLCEILEYIKSAHDLLTYNAPNCNAIECVAKLADVWHKTKG